MLMVSLNFNLIIIISFVIILIVFWCFLGFIFLFIVVIFIIVMLLLFINISYRHIANIFGLRHIRIILIMDDFQKCYLNKLLLHEDRPKCCMPFLDYFRIK